MSEEGVVPDRREISDDQLMRDSAKAHHAKMLLENELFQEMYYRVEKQTLEYFESSTEYDPVKQKLLWDGIRAIKTQKNYLEGLVEDGKLADADIKLRNEEINGSGGTG